jgi:hypothetical protein
MDLYGTSGNAIAQGNMRTQSVRDLNDKIRQHNQEVADRITGLKEQTKTADTIKEALDTGKTLWEGSKMPGAIKSYQDWKADQAKGKAKGSNPDTATNNTLRENATEGDPMRQAMGENDLRDAAGEEVRAEGSPAGASLSEEAESVAGSKGKLQNGVESLLEDGLTEDGLSKLGKAAGAIGGATTMGVDLYQDFKGGKGFHLAGDNWEEKAGNALSLAGSAADIVGTFYPPAAIIGGAVDLASSAFDAIGEKVSEDKESDDLTQQQQQETMKEVSAPAQQTITTGRVQ